MISSWWLRLIAVNVIVFLLSLSAPAIVQTFMLVPAWVLERPWTVITYMFLHGGIWHLFFNMLALWFFGPRLEMEVGGKHFLILYFVSGLMGAALSFVFTPHTAIIGASGAIFGVLIGYAHFWPKDRIFIWGILPVEVRWFVIGMTALSLFGGFSGGGDDVAHFAHLGGFLGGWLYVRWIDRRSRRRIVQAAQPVTTPSSTDIQRWAAIDRQKMHEVNREEYDRITTKIQTQGPASLTAREREFLDRFSQV